VFNGEGFSVWKDGKVLEMDGGDGCTALRMNRTLVKMVHLYYAHFTTI
jgi:hypothetical protein